MQFLLFAPLASPADSANLGLSKTPDYLFFILVIAQVNNHAPIGWYMIGWYMYICLYMIK